MDDVPGSGVLEEVDQGSVRFEKHVCDSVSVEEIESPVKVDDVKVILERAIVLEDIHPRIDENRHLWLAKNEDPTQRVLIEHTGARRESCERSRERLWKRIARPRIHGLRMMHAVEHKCCNEGNTSGIQQRPAVTRSAGCFGGESPRDDRRGENSKQE